LSAPKVKDFINCSFEDKSNDLVKSEKLFNNNQASRSPVFEQTIFQLSFKVAGTTLATIFTELEDSFIKATQISFF
jgi:hypothetical protein